MSPDRAAGPTPAPAQLPPHGAFVGRVSVPGDKSSTQRALLLGAVAEGRTEVRGALAAGDTLATAAIVAQLGAGVLWGAAGSGRLSITGVESPRADGSTLDCRNAGTAARLLMGLLAGYPGRWMLDGDGSLRRRPMGRVAVPLRAMGADISGDRLPLTVRGADSGASGAAHAACVGATARGRLLGLRHEVTVPSAQVKSALLLAGLRADGPTTVVQHVPTRDHTERMLARFGVRVEVEPGEVRVHPGRPRAAVLDIPGDPSSAAFLVVASLLVPGSDVWVADVGLWPRRTGFLRALQRAGADLMVLRRDDALPGAAGGSGAAGAVVREARDAHGALVLGETAGTRALPGAEAGADPRGDVRAGASELAAFDIAPEDVPDLVDEIPILALAAARARGTSRFAGLAELRVKESDRIAAIAELLDAFGVPVEAGPDSIAITGVRELRAPSRELRFDDHRLALTAAVACASAGFPLPPLEAADISFPGFAGLLRACSAAAPGV